MTLRSALGRPPGSRRTPLGHARGLGSTGRGTEHWYWERLTALALTPLTVWFVIALLSGVGSGLEAMQAWLSVPGNMVLLILLNLFSFWHAQIAIGVVITDYVHHEAAKMAGLITVKFGCIVLAAFATVAIVMTGLQG